ncbi:MAG TPA: hypothetical protein DCF68_16855, partial [Cyanothece sp. UBA12306]|nr:hypothetical protein [Cyanothece sp. UBA12306]
MSQSPKPRNFPSRLVRRLLRIAQRPTNIAIGVSSVTIVLIGYTGLRLFLKEYLPLWLENQGSQLIDRPLEIGELQGFSPTHLALTSISVPATPEHPNQLTISKVIVDFNPLAVLFKQTLPIKITTENIDVNISQYPQGHLFNIEVKKINIPINLELILQVKNADLDILAYGATKPFKIKLNGQAKYFEQDLAKLQYDFNLALLDSQVNLQGETVVDTRESQVKLTVDKLDFSQLTSFIVNFPFALSSGDLQANLNFNTPSLKNLQEIQGQGNLDLSNIQGRIEPLTKPFEALANISFKGSKMLVNQAQFSLGKIKANLQGEYDWKNGSNFTININDLTGTNLNQILPVALPFKFQGELEANLNLTGTLKNLLLKGKIINKNNFTIAQTKFKEIYL